MRENKVTGNFNGVLTDPLLMGGVLLVSPDGEVVWVHQEGRGPVPYEDLEGALKELACEESPVGTAEPKSWLEGAVDGLMSFFG
mmetsp:Transcript_65621/g.186167  ORF Transcript_65621/g.186167 Transcript_65621/m.186167 type:complete len:84 (+) Transcript_65621:664-915(+)